VLQGGIRTPLQRHIGVDFMIKAGWLDKDGKEDRSIWKTTSVRSAAPLPSLSCLFPDPHGAALISV
jgi:hypothetical protein